VGYTGGKNPAPSYESVCAGDGHTEAIRVEYDPQKVSYDDLLGQFYGGHRPGGGKAQYKSAIWYHDEEQKEAVQKFVSKTGAPSVEVKPADPWYDAEDYHQKYYKKNGCSVM